MTKVLLITQDIALERMLAVTLMINGIEVTTVSNLGAVIDHLGQDFNILLMDGFFAEGCLTIRDKGFQIPILLLKDSPVKLADKGIECISNPFDFPLLKQQMNKMLKTKNGLKEKIIKSGSMTIDLSKQLVVVKDKIISMGKMEFAILVSLARRTGKIVTNEKMRRDLEAQGHFFNKSIFHHIKTLRRILRETTDERMDIKLVAGIGYLLING